jgi:hypothetical protein
MKSSLDDCVLRIFIILVSAITLIARTDVKRIGAP